MKDFKFMIPQTIEFGVGALKKLPEIMKENDLDHVFLISDHGLEALGVVKKIQDIVEEAGLKCTTYLDIQANPTSAIVADATDKYRECGASSIIALGGGGPMDVAKAVGVVATYGGKIFDYEGNFKVPGPIVPIFAIPTTAGTGSRSHRFRCYHRREDPLQVHHLQLLQPAQVRHPGSGTDHDRSRSHRSSLRRRRSDPRYGVLHQHRR